MTDTQRPPAPGRKFSDSIPLEAVQRIAKLPVVESSLNIANDVYSRVKESSSVLNWTLSTAESTMSKAVEHAIPVAEKMEKHLKRVDTLLCSSLDYVEAKVPAVKLPPHEILESTSKLVESKLQPALDRASELKQMGAEKMHMEQLMALMERAWRLWRPLPQPVEKCPDPDTPSTPPNLTPMVMRHCPPAPPPTPAAALTPTRSPEGREFQSPNEVQNLETAEEVEQSVQAVYQSCEVGEVA